MKIQEVKRRKPKSVVISIRTTEEASEWMRKHDVAPNAVFEKAIGELMNEA